jgi:NAD dependent epimerase/dehydratase family enzyme
LSSQRVEPKKLKEAGYQFQCSDLQAALKDILTRNL